MSLLGQGLRRAFSDLALHLIKHFHQVESYLSLHSHWLLCCVQAGFDVCGKRYNRFLFWLTSKMTRYSDQENYLLAEDKMDAKQIEKWLKDINGWLNPPGCESSFVSLPGHNNGCCTVGIVHEHRFAFYFWGLYSLEKHSSPVLITIDAHDDVGVPNEVIPDDLDNLHIQNRLELGLFAWLRLRSLNDAHILPALYLDFFSDVYVLLNGRDDSAAFKTLRTAQQQRDRNGRMHTVKFYNDSGKLLNDLPPDCPVFLDIDLDYFSVSNPQTGSILGSENLVSDEEIKSMLSIDGPLLRPIFHRIVGLTIALEPEYCGGLVNSLHTLDILNQELFESTLCTNACKWKKSANQ